MKRRIYTSSIVLLTAAALLTGCGEKPNSGSTNTGNAANGTNNASSGSATDGSATEQTPKQWASPPAMTIDQDKQYKAEFHTSKGNFTIELFAKDAPVTVNNFIFLAKEKFYEGVTFHRIIQSFMIQGGDPTGTGGGGPGYAIKDELGSKHTYEPGTIAMANAGPNTGGSQFFICSGEDAASLNSQPNYPIFGKVVEGMETINLIAATPVEQGSEATPSKPTEVVTINSISITEQ
ncbi:peptidylprolyl isomerase [Paenibacillus swuensis]|uniref:Peptidyl-prolyl cis-trans isomerase n=1 Tax=Paenibacillus swuensis TaxID=1178515 RepID=A0A172TLM7_9BACL|nr:peptidylprolyl isomerase [Paenibacillus swuensis]ANE47882.1 peptidylprolyl isomerase [Paenibacillus swuensis]